MSPKTRRGMLSLWVGLSVLIFSGLAWSESVPAGKARRVQGTGLILRAGTADYQPLKSGDPVSVQDMILTDPQENSKVWFQAIQPHGGDVSLGRNSAFSVMGLQNEGPATQFAGQVANGIIRFRKRLPVTNPPSSFSVFSPTALAVVMSTREVADFVVESLDEFRTTITVIRGELRVTNIREEIQEERLLRACQAVIVEKDKPPSRIMRVSGEYMKSLLDYTTIPGTLPMDVPSCERLPSVPESPLPYDYFESIDPDVIVVPGPGFIPFPVPVPIPVYPTVPTYYPTWPTLPTIPTMPTMPTVPTTPTSPTLPTVPTVPTTPTSPTLPTVPTTPTTPTLPTAPTLPTGHTFVTLPTRPTIPTLVTLPTLLTLPTRPTVVTLPTLHTLVTLPTRPTLFTLHTLLTFPTRITIPTRVTFATTPTLRTFITLPTLRTFPTFLTIRTFNTFGTLPTIRTFPTIFTLRTFPTIATLRTLPNIPTLQTFRTFPKTFSIPTGVQVPTGLHIPTGVRIPTGVVPTTPVIRTFKPMKTTSGSGTPDIHVPSTHRVNTGSVQQFKLKDQGIPQQQQQRHLQENVIDPERLRRR